LTKSIWTLLLGIALLVLAVVMLPTQQVVREGATVTLDYILTLGDGTVYYSSVGNEPLQAILGENQLLPSFEEQVIGMRVGEIKTFTLPPEKAYGSYRPDMVGTLNRSTLADGLEPEIGKQVQTELKDGTPTLATITSFTDSTVTLDANHPLAGQTLTFQIKILKIDENPALDTWNAPTTSSLVIFIAGVVLLGLAVFYRRNVRSSVVVKRNAHPRPIR
jgi:peptidylprolyl isomerase